MLVLEIDSVPPRKCTAPGAPPGPPGAPRGVPPGPPSPGDPSRGGPWTPLDPPVLTGPTMPSMSRGLSRGLASYPQGYPRCAEQGRNRTGAPQRSAIVLPSPDWGRDYSSREARARSLPISDRAGKREDFAAQLRRPEARPGVELIVRSRKASQALDDDDRQRTTESQVSGGDSPLAEFAGPSVFMVRATWEPGPMHTRCSGRPTLAGHGSKP